MYGIVDDGPITMSKLVASIRKHEGLRLHPYTDTLGNITIGYGRNLTGKGISNAEAAELLNTDIQDAIYACEAKSWWKSVSANDARARALIEICFNIGLGSLLAFHEALSSLSSGNYEAAAQNFLDSKWAAQVGQRATVLAEMIRSGSDSSLA